MEPIKLFNLNTGNPVTVIYQDSDNRLFNRLNKPVPDTAVQYLADFILRFNLNPFNYGIYINGYIYTLYITDPDNSEPIPDNWIPDPDPDDVGYWVPEPEQDFIRP